MLMMRFRRLMKPIKVVLYKLLKQKVGTAEAGVKEYQSVASSAGLALLDSTISLFERLRRTTKLAQMTSTASRNS